MKSPLPYLSFVATSRNDDHGGALLYRMQLFVDSLIAQCNRYHLDAELILVEWNPPPDRPGLSEALRWPADSGACPIRIIEVPAAVHGRFANADRLPLFQMIAKNAGIRRARGEFVLATNIDILFSDELMGFLAGRQLSMDRMYRVDRYDVSPEIPTGLSGSEQMAWCRDHIIRINRYGGTVEVRDGVIVPIRSAKKSFKRRMKDLFIREAPALHTNACGDFTLMAKDRWQAVRGYPELELFSLYLDGLLCYAAHYAGAREARLQDPMRIYHIEHSPGSGWSPGIGGRLMNERLGKAGISRLSYSQYQIWVNRMKRRKEPILFNKNDHWGLASESLKERAISSR